MIKIITDSAADFDLDEAARLGITVIPMTIKFGNRLYRDRYEITPDEFYSRLSKADELPQTSQINPDLFENEFKKIKDAGDTAVAIILGSKLSGSYQNAMIAAQDLDCISVIDSNAVTVGQYCLVCLALRLRDAGKSAAEITAVLNEKKEKLVTMGVLDTLEYLKKGGRISAAAATIGNVLGIKPVAAISGGEVKLIGKARGSKSSHNILNEKIKSGEVDYSLPIAVGYAGSDDILLKQYINDSCPLWKDHVTSLPVCRIGSTIGTHVGGGTIVVAFFRP